MKTTILILSLFIVGCATKQDSEIVIGMDSYGHVDYVHNRGTNQVGVAMRGGGSQQEADRAYSLTIYINEHK